MSSGLRVLLVDDHADVGRAIRIALAVAGHRLDVATGPEEAWSGLARHRYDAVLLDLNFTPGNTDGAEGLACLDRIVAADPAACVIVLTAHSGVRVAVAAMQAGARDFVMKPWRNADLLAKLDAAVARGPARIGEDGAVRRDEPTPLLLGDSAAIEAVRALVRRLGPTRAGVAVSGPAGAGRTLVARALHAAAGTAAPLTVDLRDRRQRDRLADGAAVILRHPDRLDELAQADLLDRLPAATRPVSIVDDAARLVPSLRHRLATVGIAVPPLRARDGDALLLARHVARGVAARDGLATPRFTRAAERLVVETDWPDEVRGLALAVERAVLLSGDGTIDAAALAPPPPALRAVAAAPLAFDLAETERAVIVAALRDHRHNVTQAAAALGLSRGTLYRRMERHGL